MCCVSSSEYSQYAKGGKKISKPHPTFSKTIFYVIHWTTDQIAIGIFLAEMNSKCYLSKFGAHAKNSRDPHPKDSSRSAYCNRTGNTGNISSTNSCSKCSTYSLKWCQSTIRCILFAEHSSNCCFNCIREFAYLEKTCAKTQIKANAKDADHSRNTPDEIVHS